MGHAVSCTGEDKKWERENDARTLAEAEVIKNDKTRYSGAKKEAKVISKMKQEEAKAMKKIASLGGK